MTLWWLFKNECCCLSPTLLHSSTKLLVSSSTFRWQKALRLFLKIWIEFSKELRLRFKLLKDRDVNDDKWRPLITSSTILPRNIVNNNWLFNRRIVEIVRFQFISCCCCEENHCLFALRARWQLPHLWLRKERILEAQLHNMYNIIRGIKFYTII